ncbi:MAG TPA: DUF4147 domain-containing protein [Pyrinomonadaceae bacterium]|jgi:hydroxypyruvate reductase
MMELAALRLAALEIFRQALRSVDAGEAVRQHLRLKGSSLSVVQTTIELEQERPVYSIAIGKAAYAMAAALDEALGERLTAGVLTGIRPEQAKDDDSADDSSGNPASMAELSSSEPTLQARWRFFAGGHPLPNRASLEAARASLNLLRRAEEERALVIFLISGGGSAMFEWPRNERTTLSELREANRLLVACGASISEINAVRRAFSSVKGGSLAQVAPQVDQLTLIISDTTPGDEASVASGPTLPAPVSAPDARDTVERYGLAKRLPASIIQAINQEPLKRQAVSARTLRESYVLLDNGHAIEAAALAACAAGFQVETARDLLDQQVEEGSSELLSRLLGLRRRTGNERRPVCLISGGEFACPVRGKGIGGRNAETVLRCAIEMDQLARVQLTGERTRAQMLALSAGTDGIDGNSPAAGALADETTVSRGRALNLDPQQYLNDSDAFNFFDALGDALLTGPTGTNVRDLRILLAS